MVPVKQDLLDRPDVNYARFAAPLRWLEFVGK